jgi:hypothetical protein
MRPHNVLRCRNRRHEPTLRHFLRLEVTVLEYFIVYFYCERIGGLESEGEKTTSQSTEVQDPIDRCWYTPSIGLWNALWALLSVID